MAATPVVKVIYGKPMLPDMARVLACLYEKDINFELEDMNKGKRITQDILDLQISSHGHTPALQDGTNELFGSRKICKHIAEKYGAYGYKYLLGNDPLARVSVEQWIQSEEQMFDPPSSVLVFYLAYNIDMDKKKLAKTEKNLAKVLNLYEQRLGEFDFLAGNYFTLADLNHLPNTHILETSDEYGYLFKDRKNVSRWWKNISNRDSWKKAVKKFEEEGLLFKISEADSETNRSSSKSKNGLRNAPIEGSRNDGKKGKDNEGISVNESPPQSGKEDTNPSGNSNELSSGSVKKDDGTIKSKTERQKDGSTSDNDPKRSPSENDTKPEATKARSEDKKDAVKEDEKNKSSSGEKRVDESKKHDANKLDVEGKTGEKKEYKETNSGTEVKEDVLKPGTEGIREGVEPGDKDKASASKEKQPDSNKKIENNGTVQPDNQDKKDSKTSDHYTEGKKDGLKPDDKAEAPGNSKEITQSEGDKKSEENKTNSEGNKDALKQDEKDKSLYGEKQANKPDTEGKKDAQNADDKDEGTVVRTTTGENKEDKETKLVTEILKEPDDKVKALPGKDKPDSKKKSENSSTLDNGTIFLAPNGPGTKDNKDGLKQNEDRGTVNEGKKGSAPIDKGTEGKNSLETVEKYMAPSGTEKKPDTNKKIENSDTG